MATTEALTAEDRCDRCGAAALRRVELPSGLELLFCAHDFSKHKDALDAQEARVLEELAVPA